MGGDLGVERGIELGQRPALEFAPMRGQDVVEEDIGQDAGDAPVRAPKALGRAARGRVRIGELVDVPVQCETRRVARRKLRHLRGAEHVGEEIAEPLAGVVGGEPDVGEPVHGGRYWERGRPVRK